MRASKLAHIQIHNGIAVSVKDFGEEVYCKVRARSEREAMKIASKLDWYSFSDGPGRQFARLSYDGTHVTFCAGWDI